MSVVSDTGMCSLADLMSQTGLVTDQTRGMTVDDGTSNVSITCSVTKGSGGTFAVSAQGLDSTPTTGSALSIQIPSISLSATMSSPAVGTVVYSSPQTVDEEYASHACNFYFTSKNEGVALGQVWVTFDCPMLTSEPSMSTCNLTQGFAIFENCAAQ